ncbi:MAG TPA: glycosyltransferase family 39 protein [bacterium]|jgi:4-amino-4-deoxy-L-arabinose transferase-like glycosyltransferase|nr:glycosyltransferase family 39 protein [bacterium]
MKNSIVPMPTAQHREGWFFFSLVCLWVGFVFFSFFSQLDRTFHFWGLLFNADAFPPADSAQWWKVWDESLGAILTTVIVSAATLSLGKRVRVFFQLDFSNIWARWGFDFGLGAVVLGFFWIGTGLCGLWYLPVRQGLAAVILPLLLWDGFALTRRFFQPAEGSQPRPGWSYGFLCLIGLAYVLLTLMVNLTPETFYDSMVYHLAVPQYWLDHHGLSDFPTNFFSNYPYGAETYFLNGLVFQGTEAAKMLHAVTFVFCAILAGGCAWEIGGTRSGYLALGLVLTLPLLSLNIWTTQVEGFLTLAILLFIYALNRWARNQESQWPFIAGLFAGLAVAAKYNGAIAIAAAFVILAFRNRDFFTNNRWISWAWFGAAFMLVAGPWILKNWAYTGNPTFPYFTSLFHGRHLPTEGYERLLTEQQGRIAAQWWDWLILPWKLVMANPDSYSFAGPVALALLPLIFLFKLRHPALRFLVWFSLLIFVISIAVTHILRFMVPDFVLLYILLAGVLAGGDKPFWGKAAAWIAGLSAILCFGYLANISHYYYDFAGIVSGRQTQEQYLMDSRKLTPYYDMAQWLSGHLPDDKRLLVVGDARGLYYKQPFLTNTVFDTQTLAQIAREEKDAQGIARRLRELGVDYLVVNGQEGVRVSKDYHHYELTTDQWRHLDEFIQRGTELMYSQNLQGVYGLLPELKKPLKDEKADLVLLFSPPVSQFFDDVKKQDMKTAEEDLNRVVQLYPFSSFWKKQKSSFEKSVASSK